MEEYRTSSHAVYKCIYHFVWVPKYRYAVLMPKIKERLKKILQELCEWMDAEILEGGSWVGQKQSSSILFNDPLHK